MSRSVYDLFRRLVDILEDAFNLGILQHLLEATFSLCISGYSAILVYLGFIDKKGNERAQYRYKIFVVSAFGEWSNSRALSFFLYSQV